MHVSDTRFTSIMSASANYYNTTVWGFGGNGDADDIVADEAAGRKAADLVEMGKVLIEALLKLDLASLPKRA